MNEQSKPRYLLTTTLALNLLLVTGLASAGGVIDYPLTTIADRIHVIYGPLDLPNEKNRGFRNNVVIVQTSKGVVVFDPGGSAAAGEMVVRKVKSLTDAPIVAVFDSHAHGDHWLGNEGIKRHYPDTTIYAHLRFKQRVAGNDGPRWLETINRATKGTANGKRVVGADKTVDDGDAVKIGDRTFRIHHTGSAHTDNDIMIEIVEAHTMFTGDVVRNGLLGIMESDASFKGNIAAIDYLLDKKYKHYIPGHGTAGGPDVLRGYRAYLDTLRTTVKVLYDQGKADFEMKPKVVQAVSAYKNWAGFDMRVGPHISRAYLEIEKEAF